MKKHWILLALLPLVLCGCQTDNSIAGSDTEYAEVYDISKHNRRQYLWFVFDTEKNVMDSGSSGICPVFHETDGTVTLTLSSPPEVSFYQAYQQSFHPESREISELQLVSPEEEAATINSSSLELGYTYGKELSLDTKYAVMYDVSMYGCPLYQWFVFAEEGYVLDYGVSELTAPNFEEQDGMVSISISKGSGIEMYREYFPADGEMSDWYQRCAAGDEAPVYFEAPSSNQNY